MVVVLNTRSSLFILAIALPLVRGRVQARSKQSEDWCELCLRVEFEVVARCSVHCDDLVKGKKKTNEHIGTYDGWLVWGYGEEVGLS